VPHALRGRLRSHVERPLSATGIRWARLTCLTGGAETVALDVAHAWRRDADACSSLLCVREGSAMAGTAALLVERPFEPAALWLWLTTARSVRALEPWRVGDHLLGSDFVYDDLRMWTPRPLSEATRAHDAGDDGRITLHADFAWRDEGMVGVESLLDVASGLVVATSWTRASDDRPFRRLEATGITVLGGVATPSVIAVSQPDDGYESRLSLGGQATSVPLHAAWFRPEDMPAAAQRLDRIAERALA
jgi:hypothetical protein